jgi:hypothetical protein
VELELAGEKKYPEKSRPSASAIRGWYNRVTRAGVLSGDSLIKTHKLKKLYIYIYVLVFEYAAQRWLSMGTLNFHKEKSFAPARDYLAYVPNNGDGEVAATEGRTVFCFYSHKHF